MQTISLKWFLTVRNQLQSKLWCGIYCKCPHINACRVGKQKKQKKEFNRIHFQVSVRLKPEIYTVISRVIDFLKVIVFPLCINQTGFLLHVSTCPPPSVRNHTAEAQTVLTDTVYCELGIQSCWLKSKSYINTHLWKVMCIQSRVTHLRAFYYVKDYSHDLCVVHTSKVARIFF